MLNLGETSALQYCTVNSFGSNSSVSDHRCALHGLRALDQSKPDETAWVSPNNQRKHTHTHTHTPARARFEQVSQNVGATCLFALFLQVGLNKSKLDQKYENAQDWLSHHPDPVPIQFWPILDSACDHFLGELVTRGIELPVSRKRAEYCFGSTVSENSLSLTECCGKLGEFCDKLGEFALSLWHTNSRLRGTHWVLSPELGEGQKTHWVRCLKPYSPKPYSARTACVSLKAFFKTFQTFSLVKDPAARESASFLPRPAQAKTQSLGLPHTLRLLNALNSEDRGLKVRFPLRRQHLTENQLKCLKSSQGKNAPSNPYPHYLVRLAASR